jgi:nitrate reductase NapAB chaperone NapD
VVVVPVVAARQPQKFKHLTAPALGLNQVDVKWRVYNCGVVVVVEASELAPLAARVDHITKL